MAGPSQRAEALVLRHVDYGESDRIVSLLTAADGRQKAYARGARKSRKRFGATLEPFTQIVAYWHAGRGQFWSLQDTELLDSRSGLRAELPRLALAGYGVELIEMLIEEGQPHPEIFELLCAFLDHLAAAGDLSVSRLLLELRLVYLLGYIPHLLHCSECLHIFNQEPVRFSAERGGSLCLACAGRSGIPVEIGTLGSLARTLNVVHTRFSGFRFGTQTLRDGHAILAQVLGLVLPREPKSLRFLEPG